MPSFAEKLFDFSQRRQAMQLEQDKFAEARRQFDVNAELNNIQQNQNSRRLDLLDTFQQAQIAGATDSRAIQREGIALNRDEQKFREQQAKDQRELTELQLIQSGRFVRGERGELVPVDQTVLSQEARDQNIENVFDFAKELQTRGGLNKRESFAVAAGTPALVQQPSSGSPQLNAALLNARFSQETMAVIGQARAKALEQGKEFEDLGISEVSKLIDEVTKDTGSKINQMFGSIASDPVSTLKATAINQIETSRTSQALRRAQTQNAASMKVGDAFMIQHLGQKNPGLLKIMGINPEDINPPTQ